MIQLSKTCESWPSADSASVLKDEIKHLDAGSLPLQQFTTQGGIVDDADISVTVLGLDDQGDEIRAKVGVFFTEVVGGCNCHDDPVLANAYGELRLSINRQTAEVAFNID